MKSDIRSPSAANKIKFLRENNELTLDALAAALEIGAHELEEIEIGKKDADKKLLEKIALIFQVPLSYLLEHSIENDNSLNYLARAMEDLSRNDHDELVQFADFLQSSSKEK